MWAGANEPRGAVFQFGVPLEPGEIVPAGHADPMPYIEDAVTVLDTGKRNLVRCEQAAPAAHETLVTGAHSEHLCFGFCR
jgi:hypothetical protein